MGYNFANYTVYWGSEVYAAPMGGVGIRHTLPPFLC